jgi:DNA-binding transcriptional ArsR family regulator
MNDVTSQLRKLTGLTKREVETALAELAEAGLIAIRRHDSGVLIELTAPQTDNGDQTVTDNNQPTTADDLFPYQPDDARAFDVFTLLHEPTERTWEAAATFMTEWRKQH